MGRYRDWALMILCWDGLLPLAVVSTPNLVTFLFPGRQGALEFTFVVVPVTAFVIRFLNGMERCRNGQVFAWQFAIFFIAILFLFVVDAMLVMTQLVQNGVPIEVWKIMAVLYCIYLALMAIALFPARRRLNDECGQVGFYTHLGMDDAV